MFAVGLFYFSFGFFEMQEVENKKDFRIKQEFKLRLTLHGGKIFSKKKNGSEYILKMNCAFV